MTVQLTGLPAVAALLALIAVIVGPPMYLIGLGLQSITLRVIERPVPPPDDRAGCDPRPDRSGLGAHQREDLAMIRRVASWAARCWRSEAPSPYPWISLETVVGGLLLLSAAVAVVHIDEGRLGPPTVQWTRTEEVPEP